MKEATGNISGVAQVAALCDIDIYSGNDDQIVPLLSLGGKGVISVLSNVLPRETHDICAKWFAGDVQGARELQLHYLKLINALFSDVQPHPCQGGHEPDGDGRRPRRLPLCDMEDDAREKLSAVLREYGLVK